VRVVVDGVAGQSAEVDVEKLAKETGIEVASVSASAADFCIDGRVHDIDHLLRILEAGNSPERARIREVWCGKECFYERLPEVEFKTPDVENVGVDAIRDALKDVDILVVTVTPTERKAVLHHLGPLPGRTTIVRGSVDLLTFRVGKYGRYAAAHVESAMGSSTPQGSAFTVLEAIDVVHPRAVFVLGYAFGVRSADRRIGDVLVADAVAPYELGKVTAEGTSHRALPLPSGLLLRERFGSYADDWKLLRADGATQVAPKYGLVLSGEKVVADDVFLSNLKTPYPNAIGGEMEGTGAYGAAERRSVPILLVKGICDWADGHKKIARSPLQLSHRPRWPSTS
jgi:nucleoside phosphorylase